RPPFKAPTALDTILLVVADEPVPPSRLQPKTPRDLETICLKCLQKEPRKRYAAASDLAEDLRRYQVGEPVQARPVGRLEWMGTWARRRPALAALLAVSVLAATGLLVGGVWFTVQLDRARQKADAKRDEADNQRGLADQRARDLKNALVKVQEEERK